MAIGLKGKHGIYSVNRPLGENSISRWFLCEDSANGAHMIQVANGIGANNALDQMASALIRLKRQSDVEEKHYAENPEAYGRQPHFDWLFPELVESFICEEQGGLRVNALRFVDIAPDDLTPLYETHVLNLMVDLQTSVWIFGRLLKTIWFAHVNGVSVGNIDATKVFIGPKNHRVILLDWTGATTPDVLPDSVIRAEVTSAVKAVLNGVLGCDNVNGPCCMDPASCPSFGAVSPEEKSFIETLRLMASGTFSNASHAYEALYETSVALWGIKFREFTATPIPRKGGCKVCTEKPHSTP